MVNKNTVSGDIGTGSGEERHAEGSTRTSSVQAEDRTTASRRRSAVPSAGGTSTAATAAFTITSRQHDHGCSTSTC